MPSKPFHTLSPGRRLARLLGLFAAFALMCPMPACAAASSSGPPDRAIKRVEVRKDDGSTRKVPFYSGYYAMVVGCGDYQAGWPQLPNPVKDARDVAGALQEMGWQVDLLEDPNWSTLRSALYGIVAGPGKDADKGILLWFSGHGHTLNEADGTKLGYIVPVDAPDPDRDAMGFMQRAISMREMETVAKGIESKHVMMVFDSCFSGAIFSMSRAKPSPYIEEKTLWPVRQFITAGTENEKVPDRSMFKICFLQGLRDGFADVNRDGYVTGEELGAYLQEMVVNYTNRAQSPQFGKINNPKLDKGDFVFVSRMDKSLAIPDVRPLPKKREGTLVVRSEPNAARWYLDGDFAGKTNDEMAGVTEGWHEVRVEKPGYRTWTEQVRIVSGERAVVSVWLESSRVEPVQGAVWKEPVTDMAFVWVPGGCFPMGSPDTDPERDSDEGPVHEVCVDGFWMGRYEVTNRQFRMFRPERVSGSFKGQSLDEDPQPAVSVNWSGAASFARWLEGKNGGKRRFRLPTEAEWEYACRAGSTAARFWGDAAEEACGYANVYERRSTGMNRAAQWAHDCVDGYTGSAPVGTFAPNGFGLYDMLGNVWEWCNDFYDPFAYAAAPRDNPRGPAGGAYRVVRGGAYNYGPKYNRCAFRYRVEPGASFEHIGFRLVALDSETLAEK